MQAIYGVKDATKPVIESYHTVWFELHEDLLVTLGLDRAAETALVDDNR